MTGRRRAAMAFAALLCLTSVSYGAPARARAAATIHVPADYATIQAAINAATTGDTVLVADGTYLERLTIAKDITVESENGPDTTIVDGQLGGSVVTMTAAGNAVLRGFTIRNGGGGGTEGGGIWVTGGPVLIEQNDIVDNLGCGSGGGIYANTSSATIQDNYIARNHQSTCSGGTGGGGIAISGGNPVQVLHNTIEDNAFGTNGGGIFVGYAPGTRIDRNIIRGNVGLANGGGIHLGSSGTTVTNNLIAGNTAGYGGGLSWSVSLFDSFGPYVIGNTFVGNTAYSSGQAVYGAGYQSIVVLKSNVLVGAEAGTTVSCNTTYTSAPPQLSYNDAWNPSGPEYDGSCATATGTNGNISVDPKFVDPALGDYHLRPDSPVIDAGESPGFGDPDIDGDARPFDGDENGTTAVDPGFDEAVDPLLIDPASIEFPSSPPLVAATPVTVTLQNFGSGPLTISSVSLGGADAADFSLTNQTCAGTVLAVSVSCTFKVGFTSSAIGDRSAHVTISGPGAVGTRTIPLAGTALDPVLVAPSSVNFGTAPHGTADTPATVTVTNYGAAPLTVTSLTLGGANAADFSIGSQSCTSVPVPVAMACSISVGFTPGALGARSGTLTISGPFPLGDRVVTLSGTGGPPLSGVVWGSTSVAGPSYTWNGGGALARTVASGSQRLHLVYATDRVGGKWATDSGPYVGVYYIRNSSGTTWTTPFRLNPSTQHAARLGLAAAGSRVYATWVSQTKWVHFSGTAARVLYVRVNTNHGATTSWRTAVRLSSTTGRVDYPTIAASGADAHIAWTDSGTGSVRVTTSRDYGVTWKTTALGTTTLSSSSGRFGYPAVAVSGSTVAVAYLADSAGTIKMRVSTNRGVTWGTTATVGTGSIGTMSVAVRGTRIAVAWTTDDDVVVRQRTAGVWDAPQAVASLPAGEDPVPYAPVVTLQDPNRIAVTWTEEQASLVESTLRTIESSNGGASWYQPQTLASTSSSSHRANDWASVLWISASTRYVAWNGWTSNTNYYRQYLRKGTGTAVGPLMVAPNWTATTTDPLAASGPATPWVGRDPSARSPAIRGAR